MPGSRIIIDKKFSSQYLSAIKSEIECNQFPETCQGNKDLRPVLGKKGPKANFKEIFPRFNPWSAFSDRFLWSPTRNLLIYSYMPQGKIAWPIKIFPYLLATKPRCISALSYQHFTSCFLRTVENIDMEVYGAKGSKGSILMITSWKTEQLELMHERRDAFQTHDGNSRPRCNYYWRGFCHWKTCLLPSWHCQDKMWGRWGLGVGQKVGARAAVLQWWLDEISANEVTVLL